MPLMAASVSTFVVSWNEAAEIKLSVERLAFVIPIKSDFASVESLHQTEHVSVSSGNATSLLAPPTKKSESPTSVTSTRPHHLSHNHFDMLIVDAHPLETVDFLDRVHERFGELALSENAQDIMGI